VAATHDNALGAWIRERRTAQGVSQRELADRASMSRSYLCDLERGRGKQPSLAVLQSLARALGEDQDEVLRQAGLLNRAPERGGDIRERRVVALFRALSESGQDSVERFTRFLHADEQRWVQASFAQDGESEDGHAAVRHTGPRLFELP
jgi:transcriptional regulator with XRE-family HTH domain